MDNLVHKTYEQLMNEVPFTDAKITNLMSSSSVILYIKIGPYVVIISFVIMLIMKYNILHD